MRRRHVCRLIMAPWVLAWNGKGARMVREGGADMKMARWIGLLVMALGIGACGHKAVEKPVEDGPLIETNALEDRPVLWQMACFKLTGNPQPANFDPEGDYDVKKETNQAMVGCVKGFMAMESQRAADTAKCVIAAENQEGAFWCLEGGASLDDFMK